MQSNFFCKSSYLNLYKKPSYKSKIGSQILYGEKFRILLKKKKFIKFKTLFDNFIGNVLIAWIRASQGNKEESIRFLEKIPRLYQHLKLSMIV